MLYIITHKGNTNKNGNQSTARTPERLKFKGLKAKIKRMPNVGEDAEQLEFLLLLAEVSINTACLKNGLPEPSKTQYTPTLGYLPKRNECLCPLKDLYENIHSSFIPNTQQLETMRMSINRRMDRLFMVYQKMECYVAIRKKLYTYKCSDAGESHRYCIE